VGKGLQQYSAERSGDREAEIDYLFLRARDAAARLRFAARVRNGFVPALGANVFLKFKSLESLKCPFANLPQSSKGR